MATADSADDRFIRRERIDGAIAVIALNKPPLNLIDIPLLDGLLAALRAAGDDDTVRAVVLTTDLKRAFSAGLDLVQVLDGGSALMRPMLQRLYIDLYDLQHDLGKPSIAAIRGLARGGGMSIAVSCNMIVAADDASFGYPELNVGILPGLHFTHLPRLVGRHKAFELLFGGEPSDAAEAHRLGLVNQVTPPADVQKAALAIARRLAAKPPEAMKLAREHFMRINDRDYRNDIASVVDTMAAMIDSPETRIALERFLKRSDRDLL